MSKKIKTIKKRRVCRFTGCRHILSIYNLETYCHVHQQAAMAREAPTVSIARC
ncbi:MAG: hypothetical protein HZA30_05630 [Candidatus Omnitrophica bacterium]|nr:hypothetical protein [Candidatus Omnitrophota bacterium]